MTCVGLLEDNPRIARLCATMLQFAGYSVDVYEHPQQCLNAFVQPVLSSESNTRTLTIAPAPSPVDLLILDLQLPGMTGIEVLQQLKMMTQVQMLPLILCTAANPGEIMQALRIAPHAGVVEKPFKLDVLVSAVASGLHSPLPR